MITSASRAHRRSESVARVVEIRALIAKLEAEETKLRALVAAIDTELGNTEGADALPE
jgi:hypothetical protein